MQRGATLRADNPEVYIPGDRRRALAGGPDVPEVARGAALFADISGFTPLTEALVAELGARRGAEELTAALDTVFDAVLGVLHRFGGTVIYFSGDAVTCWLDGDDGLVAVACALAMQEVMTASGTLTTPGGTTVELGMKVAVAAGTARRFVVGDPDIQLIDVLAGSLMDRLAGAEHFAEPGEVLVEAETLEGLRGRLVLGAARREDGDGGASVVVSVAGAPPVPPAPLRYPRLPRAVVRQWLLPPVYERMRTGRGEFLAELRSAVPMFVRFGGIDFDADVRSPAQLDEFVRLVQGVVDGHGGNVLQLTVGDKGAYLYAVFGSPVAHEDDAARACAAALDVLALEGTTVASGLQIGIASGRLRSGTYGHAQRRTFCCLGDAVNVAARLMSAAPAGEAYTTTDVERSSRGRFHFEEVGTLALKGKSGRVAVRRLTGSAATGRAHAQYAGRPLIGRARELDRLVALAERALEGEGQVVGVLAEAGMGKSHMTSVLTEVLQERDVPVLAGAAASVGGATSYLAWQPVVAGLLGLGPQEQADGGLRDRLGRALDALDPSLVPRLPLLGVLLGAAVEDNELTATFSAKLRKTSLESLVVQVLARRTGQGPVVVVLEDCHWLDPLSVDLLDLVARSAGALPVLVLLTYRPGSFAAPDLPHTTVVDLEGLDDESSRGLLSLRLGQLYGEGTAASGRVLERLVERAHGNPFFLEELASYLHDCGADPGDPDTASLELPSSLASLVLSRVDALGERPRRTLKVASVVGREFGVATLTGAYPELGTPPRVTGHLRTLCAEDLVVAEAPADDRYAFKHAVIQEVAYESLPFSLRAKVHGRIGLWLEAADPESLDLLAHHFWHSHEEERKRHYLLLAGVAARARFANDAAIDYFRRLAPLLPPGERIPVLAQLGAVLELPGRWSEAEAVYSEVLALAEAGGSPLDAARARLARADPVRKQGRFEEAAAELDLAEPVLAAGNDTGSLGRVAHLRGVIANQKGAPEEAWTHFERSLEIQRERGDSTQVATALANLGVSAGNQGDYDAARRLTSEALELRRNIGDRWGIAVSENNLGMTALVCHEYHEALPHLDESLRAFSEIGDLLGIATALQNLGNCYRELGDAGAARRHYARALEAYRVTGDQWLLWGLFEDVAMLVVGDDPAVAFRLVGAAAAVRDAIGAVRMGYEDEEVERHLADARRALGSVATREEAAGRSLVVDAAVVLALECCAAG
jgi:adenylate cyclase